uniref:DUF4375 domain-containing protein n=2 Tax=unclassified bacterial viruses TaxID=12333 RepID=A0AAU6VYY1_9VIRU
MVERNVDAMVEAIRDWELDAGEGFTDYFLDNWPVGSWAYWLLGKGHTEWANAIINANEEKQYVDQELKFEWFDPYTIEKNGSEWHEEIYLKNVRVWAEFLVESDQYFRRVNKFFDTYFTEEGEES